MKLKIALIQCVICRPYKRWGNNIGWSPNIGLSLIASDLKKMGFSCCPILAFDSHEKENQKKLLDFLQEQSFDIIGLHSVLLNEQLVKKISETLPEAKILVGGPTSYVFLPIKNINFIISGEGRISTIMLMNSLKNHGNIDSVPNLFYRDGSRINHSGKILPYVLEKEIFPFWPETEWTIIGSNYNAKFEHASILANTGCQHHLNVGNNPLYRNIKRDIPEFFKKIATNKAKKMIEKIIDDCWYGCSFCTQKIDTNIAFADSERTVQILLEQIEFWKKYWQSERNLKIIEIIGQYPLSYLNNFIKEVELPFPAEFRVDVRVDEVIRNSKNLEKTLKLCKLKDIRIRFISLGIENFVQKHLDIYNKGTTVNDNLKTIKILINLRKKYGRNFEYSKLEGGFILLNPWTTLEDLEENIRYLKKFRIYKIFTHPIFPYSSLVMYGYNPIYYKALNDNLLVEKNLVFRSSIISSHIWEKRIQKNWKYADERVDLIFQLLLKFSPFIIEDYGDWNKINFKLLKMMEYLVNEIKSHKEISEIDKFVLERKLKTKFISSF